MRFCIVGAVCGLMTRDAISGRAAAAAESDEDDAGWAAEAVLCCGVSTVDASVAEMLLFDRVGVIGDPCLSTVGEGG